MLFVDITNNRYRIEQIIQRLMDAADKEEMSTILQMLVREGLLSDEQFKQLGELEDPHFEKITEVIMDTKSVQGLNFLPLTIGKLRHFTFLTDRTGRKWVRVHKVQGSFHLGRAV